MITSVCGTRTKLQQSSKQQFTSHSVPLHSEGQTPILPPAIGHNIRIVALVVRPTTQPHGQHIFSNNWTSTSRDIFYLQSCFRDLNFAAKNSLLQCAKSKHYFEISQLVILGARHFSPNYIFPHDIFPCDVFPQTTFFPIFFQNLHWCDIFPQKTFFPKTFFPTPFFSISILLILKLQ